MSGLAAQEGRTAIHAGDLTVTPTGFFETIGMYRSATTQDSVSTKFGRIPLDDTDGQWLNSVRHSRLMLKSDLPVGAVKFSTYLESDFMNFAAGQSPWRWRQYWGRAEFGKWEILGGQAWSLLRPNRDGIASDRDVMSTDVVEPNYHTGLLGYRRRQVRISRRFDNYKLAVAWEGAGNFLAKLARDAGRTHLELQAVTGRHGRRGVGAAAVVKLTPKLRAVTQQYWGKRNIDEALGVAPAGRNGFASLAGVEYQVRKSLELYSYGGLVYASRSRDNRIVREYTVGFSRKQPFPQLLGTMIFSAQFSRTGRAVWTGRSGEMNYLMCGFRYVVR